MTRTRPTLYRIPVCPFSQRAEILLALKARSDAVRLQTVDITRPRSPELLALTGGSTSLPVLDLGDGRVLKESLVILSYLEDSIDGPAIRRADPYERAVEAMLVALEGPFVAAGYRLVMNRDPASRQTLADAVLAQYRLVDAFLRRHSPEGPFLFDRFGYAEAVFAPIFARFWFLAYYEGLDCPADRSLARFVAWRDACLAHPAAGQVCREEIVKLYYDYALGAGNGALPAGRSVSSFAFSPHWADRPWPPADKYGRPATDAELGLAGFGHAVESSG